MIQECIYCRTTDKCLFTGREHVIPQSFGTFSSDTPTLRCVCDGCNAYFSKALDQGLARDTLEGVTRYKSGIVPREVRPIRSLQFSLRETDENGEFSGALVEGVDTRTGKLLSVASQVWIRNIRNNEWEKYRLEEIKNILIDDETYGVSGKRALKVIAPSQEHHDAVVQELAKCGIPYKQGDLIAPPPFTKKADEDGMAEIAVNIHGIIGKDKKRALAKILFNFAAYHLGENEALKEAWNQARQFIRYDGEVLPARISEEPFWTGQETDGLRFSPDSYNLRIENVNGNVVGVIQIYNLFTYEFVLVENYVIQKEVGYRFTPGEKPYLGVKAVLL